MKLFEVEQPITPAQLNALEKALDALFKSLGIDVEFTRHFIDRVNDERNQEQITMPELINMFKKEYKRWGKPIAQMGPDSEAVMKDLESDINIPFVLKWDRDNQELDLVAKSIMRKKNFKTSNKEFPVEDVSFPSYTDIKHPKKPQPKLPIDKLPIGGMAATAAAGVVGSTIGNKLGKDLVKDPLGQKDVVKKRADIAKRKMPSMGGGGPINPTRLAKGGGRRFEPKLKNSPFNLVNEKGEFDDNLFEDWYNDYYKPALNRYPQIGNFMKRNYLNPNNKSSVKQFAKVYPDKLQTIQPYLSKAAKLYDLPLVGKDAATGFVKGALKLRGANPTDNDMKFGSSMVSKFKNQYPDAWKMVKKGNLKGALNNIGIKTEAKEEDIVKLFSKYGLIETEFEPHMMYKGDKKKMAKTHADHIKLGKEGWSHDNPKTKKVEEMPIPKSTMYGLVIDGKYVAKGSKEKMRKMQKEKGGTVYNAPGKKVGDSEGKVKESGIMYKAGVKKYGKAGMKAIQSAAGKGASAEEIGAIKDKHNKKKVKEENETPTPMRRMSDEEKLAMFNELKAGDTVYLWYDSAFKRGEKYKPFKMGRRTKSEKYNLSKFSMQQISAEGIPAGVKFFLYKRGDKISLAMGDMAATLVDMQTSVTYPKVDVKEMDDDTEQWYYQEVADHMGASLMNYKEMPGGRDITFGYKGQEVLVRQRWNKDGTEKKPVTTVVTDNDSADLGRYAVWNDSKFYADDLIDTISKMDEGYKISSKKPLSSLGGYGDKKLAKKQPSVGDGLSEDEDFYLVVEYKKGKPVRQSDPLRVLDNLAARKDNMPFPIKFANDEEIKVTPELAKRFTMAYHDIAKPEQKDLIKKYLRTKDGFKKVVNQMQLKKDDFGKMAGANLAGLSRDSDLVR
tara:strand:- start:4397 stop:7081 length:2685 start_codon:yes stop_codon:yes gene_type:complete